MLLRRHKTEVKSLVVVEPKEKTETPKKEVTSKKK